MWDARQEHKRSWTLEAFFAAAGSTSATSCGCSCALNTLQDLSWEDPHCFRKAFKFQMVENIFWNQNWKTPNVRTTLGCSNGISSWQVESIPHVAKNELPVSKTRAGVECEKRIRGEVRGQIPERRPVPCTKHMSQTCSYQGKTHMSQTCSCDLAGFFRSTRNMCFKEIEALSSALSTQL